MISVSVVPQISGITHCIKIESVVYYRNGYTVTRSLKFFPCRRNFKHIVKVPALIVNVIRIVITMSGAEDPSAVAEVVMIEAIIIASFDILRSNYIITKTIEDKK